MNRIFLYALALSLSAQESGPSLRGTVTDPSGSAVPGAVIQLRGPRGQLRAKTTDAGEYSFPSLPRGKYQIRIAAQGFSIAEKKDFSIDRPKAFDVRLAIHTETLVINVEDALGRVSPAPEANAGGVFMRERQIAALSDDPDELALQLQALAGPAPGPNGGQMFIDGFSGGSLPPKSSIREIRINANPFSPEYDRPGFARIDIFTKPGSDSLHGQAFVQFNNQDLNSRNPLLAQSARPPYQTRLFGFNVSGPLRRKKASYSLDLEHRRIDENAFILATTLDTRLNLVPVNQALATPQSRTTISPRLDLALTSKHTLVVRDQETRIALDNQGVGDFSLASRAYNEDQTDSTAQITETAMFSQRLINETRFQYFRSSLRDTAGSAAAGVNVQGAFFDGGATIGNSRSTANNWEATNITSFNRGTHSFKWGGRARQTRVDDVSLNNFAGTFTFYTLAQYQRTLALEQSGYSGAQIVQLGAGPSVFTRNAGAPETLVAQSDAGLFVNDDWRARPNLTLSYGLRYEAQTNFGDQGNWAPRLALAWAIGGKGSQSAKTVVRAGLGAFYDRIPASVTLNARRFDGVSQQSFFILNPAFFPNVPAVDALQAGLQPQQLRPVAAGIETPRMYQGSVGIERQLNTGSKLALTWIGTRGLHLLDVRNVNTPLAGIYPYGGRDVRLLTESAGVSRQNQFVANLNGGFKKVTIFGNYTLSYGRDNNEGPPADPFNLRGEWGPSSYGDVRQRLVLGSTLPGPAGFTIFPFFVVNSGVPYNITTGLDPLNTGSPTARPAVLRGVGGAACSGAGRMYAAGLGCFDLAPAVGTPIIEHNFGRGPSAVNLALRIARTWTFGGEATATPRASSADNAGHGATGPPAGMFDARPGRRYNLTLSASSLNALNHPNYAPPNGDLSSSYFGQSRSLGGLIVMAHGGAPSTYNRKIDLQLRFTW